MGETVLGVVSDVVTLCEELFMVCGVFCIPFQKKKGFFLCGAALFAGICASDLLFGYFGLLTLLLRAAAVPSVVLLWTKGGVLRRLSIFLCATMYLHLPYLCIDLLSARILGMPLWEAGSSGVYQVARGALTCIIAAALAAWLRRRQSYREAVQAAPTKYFLLGGLCCLAASLVQHYIEEASRVAYGNAGLGFFIMGCMILVSILFYGLGAGIVVLDLLRKKYQAESRLKDEFLRMTREYVRTVRENARETRKMRHDLQAHAVSLRYYLEHKEYEKAVSYLSAIQEHMGRAIQKTATVNHEIVDAVLLAAIARGEAQGIRWEVSGMLPAGLQIGDYDLCTMFSNLLSNSVEACEKVPREKRYVQVEIRRLENHLVIEIKNPTEGKVEIRNLGAVTSKEDQTAHGYGIANARAAAEKNHGELLFESREGEFMARILLYGVSVQ